MVRSEMPFFGLASDSLGIGVFKLSREVKPTGCSGPKVRGIQAYCCRFSYA